MLKSYWNTLKNCFFDQTTKQQQVTLSLEILKIQVTLRAGAWHYNAQKLKFSITDFFCECDQIRRNLRIWSHLLKKSVMENFSFCAMLITYKKGIFLTIRVAKSPFISIHFNTASPWTTEKISRTWVNQLNASVALPSYRNVNWFAKILMIVLQNTTVF